MLVIFWKGWGISVIFIGLFWYFVTAMEIAPALGHHYFHGGKFEGLGNSDAALSFALASLSTFALATYRKLNPRTIFASSSNETMTVAHVDTLYGLNLTIWAAILFSIAAFYLYRFLVSGSA